LDGKQSGSRTADPPFTAARYAVRSVDGEIGFTVAVIISGLRNIACLPELSDQNASQTRLCKPRRRRRTENGRVGFAVAVKISRGRRVAVCTEREGVK
jgi:hypothetical protein